MEKDIRHQWFLQHPPELVWAALTEKEQLSQWLMENDMQPIVGHKFRFVTKPRIKMGFDGIVYCEVLEVMPFKRFSYSWKGGPRKGVITLDSVVRWTLIPKNGGTELVLEHTGFKGWKNYFSYLVMNMGWVKIGKRFIARLNKIANEATHR